MEPFIIEQAGKLALQGAGWLVAVIEGALVWYLIRELKDCNEARIAASDKMLDSTLKASTSAAQEQARAFDAMRATLETRGRAVEDLSRQVDKSEQEIRHGVANLATALNAVAAVTQRILDGVQRVLDTMLGRRGER